MSNLGSIFSKISSESGFTLIELLVSVAVLGIILTSLAQIFTAITGGMFSAQAQGDIIENLNMIADQIASDLRNIARNNETMNDRYGKNYYRLVIVDGDGKYEDENSTQHGNLGTDPNDHSDRIHMFTTYSNDELDQRIEQADAASERVYIAYWVNGPTSGKIKSEFETRYGILKRRRIHEKEARADGHVIPYYSAEDKEPPLLDINTSDERQSGASPFGFNIDYFSVRAYDPVEDAWIDGDQTNDCSVGETDDGSKIIWDSAECGRYPSAIEFSIRGYDARANDGDIPESRLVEPIWFKTAVSLR